MRAFLLFLKNVFSTLPRFKSQFPTNYHFLIMLLVNDTGFGYYHSLCVEGIQSEGDLGAHSFNPSTGETEVGGSLLSSRLA